MVAEDGLNDTNMWLLSRRYPPRVLDMGIPTGGVLGHDEYVLIHRGRLDRSQPHLRGRVAIGAPTPDTMSITVDNFYIRCSVAAEDVPRAEVGMFQYRDDAHFDHVFPGMPDRVSSFAVVVNFRHQTGTVVARNAGQLVTAGPLELCDRQIGVIDPTEMTFTAVESISLAAVMKISRAQIRQRASPLSNA